MDVTWLERWRDDVRAATATLPGRFEARFGFPPGDHRVSGPATAAELAGLSDLHGDALPADLLTFHRVIAEVRLPDINNGYWIHRPPLPGNDPGRPRLLSNGRAVATFGSDGGGATFALTPGSATGVLRLSGGTFLDAAYDADSATTVAADLQEFLAALRQEVIEFAATT